MRAKNLCKRVAAAGGTHVAQQTHTLAQGGDAVVVFAFKGLGVDVVAALRGKGGGEGVSGGGRRGAGIVGAHLRGWGAEQGRAAVSALW